MNRRLLASLVGTLLLLVALLPAAATAKSPAAGQFTKDGIYVVQMADLPVIAFTGDKKGHKATAPRNGQKIDPTASGIVAYADYLRGQHASTLRKVGAASRLYDYVYTYNGFAARLTAAQANELAATKGVLAVSPDETRFADTSSTPTFLGLTDPQDGLWARLGGPTRAGDGIIIGVIDSGIWPESLSFADRVDKKTGQPSDAPGAKLVYHQVPGWHGMCVSGEAFSKTQDCNQKLIGAQWFDASFADPALGLTGDAGLKASHPWEFASARDYNGHGTHTSSTAGGNYDTPTTGEAAVFGPVNGMAPHARIAMYKALYSLEDGSQASGATSDLVAAIDKAVADGVDVINYSISGTRTNFADPVEISFLFAADAGIFVAESAGNDGPGSGTVAHPSPWTTTVAAGTHNRDGQGSVTLGNGMTYHGASVAAGAGPAPIINASATGLPGADPDEVRLCYSTVDTGGDPVLDPAKVEGKIVVCERGATARINKSLAVQQAGGVGMVLINTSTNSINADLHFVPTVHLRDTDLTAVETYAATDGATATINPATIVYDAPAPFTAEFSSRGPLAAGGGDLLKPDVIAPGQDILAAVAPPGNAGRSFDVYSGTSMSSPHVAGLAALLMDLHPEWSPMAVKSALMTTAYDVLDGGTPAPNDNPILIFRQGAGHVDPNVAAHPGLVYDAGLYDWLAFLCGTTSEVGSSTCAALSSLGYSLDPSDYNGASIAIGDLAGTQTVIRRVTNVESSAATYNVAVTGMAGITTTVSPMTLTLAPGQTGWFTVTFTEDDATLNTYTGGQLTWTGAGHSVRIPLVVKPVPIAAPAEVTGTPDGISYQIVTGYAGTVDFAARGLVPAVTTDATVSQDPDQTFDPNDPTGTYAMPFSVAAGTSLLRVGIDEAFIANPGTDLDVFLFKADGTFVGQSADGDSNEMVTVANPGAGDYVVYVHGFDTAGPSTDFTLFNWEVPMTAAGNVTLPAQASTTVGGAVNVDLAFAGLDAGTWYLGQVVYNDGTADIGSTIVSVR